jgi:phosphopantothenoylcysteine decarboxylase/phosphopantothenate--cysteine ligase
VQRRSVARTADRLLVGRSPVIVGFAAETGDDHTDALGHGRAKLRRKGCDLLVVNEVGEGRGFGTLDNAGVVLDADGASVDIPHGPKEALADVVWDLVVARWAGVTGPSVAPA